MLKALSVQPFINYYFKKTRSLLAFQLKYPTDTKTTYMKKIVIFLFTFLQVNDRLHNLTDYNVSDWLVKTHDDFKMRRYGGFTLGKEVLLGKINSTQIERAVAALVSAANSNAPSLLTGTQQLWLNLETLLKVRYLKYTLSTVLFQLL